VLNMLKLLCIALLSLPFMRTASAEYVTAQSGWTLSGSGIAYPGYTSPPPISQFNFRGFDSSLGTLRSVTLEISGTGSYTTNLSVACYSASCTTLGGNTTTSATPSSQYFYGASLTPAEQAYGSALPILPIFSSTISEAPTTVFPIDLSHTSQVSFDNTLDLSALGLDFFVYGAPAYGWGFQIAETFQGVGTSGPNCYPLCGSMTASVQIGGTATVTYDYAPAIPEPATYAMMLAGLLAVAGAALAKRRPTAPPRAPI
jgi:hypothetical protein